MDVYLDKKQGCAYVNYGKNTGIVIGTVEDVEGASEGELAEMVMFAIAVRSYEDLGKSGVVVVH